MAKIVKSDYYEDLAATLQLFYAMWGEFRGVADGKRKARQDGIIAPYYKIFSSVTHWKGMAIDIQRSPRNADLLWKFWKKYRNHPGFRLGIGEGHLHFDRNQELLINKPTRWYSYKSDSWKTSSPNVCNSVGTKWWMEDRTSSCNPTIYRKGKIPRSIYNKIRSEWYSNAPFKPGKKTDYTKLDEFRDKFSNTEIAIFLALIAIVYYLYNNRGEIPLLETAKETI